MKQAPIACTLKLMVFAASAFSLITCGQQAPEPEKTQTRTVKASSPVRFEDVTEEVGLDFFYWNGMTGQHYFVENVGSGGALFDMDNDGDLDIYLVQGGPLTPTDEEPGEEPPAALAAYQRGGRLFRNDLTIRPDGTRQVQFTDVTEAAGLTATGYGMGVTAGDVDNDGRTDLYLTFFGHNQLWRNCSDGDDVCFENITDRAGVDDARWSTSAAFVDIDTDGFLDLFVANYVDFRLENHKVCMSAGGRPDYCGPQSYNGLSDRLFRNRGDGTFEDITGSAGLIEEASSGLGIVAADLDQDGRVDLYVANDMRRNFLWRNMGGNPIRFENIALESGTAVNREGRAQASMGVVAGDIDNDGDDDLFMTHLRADYNTLYRNDGQGYFQDHSGHSGLGGTSMGMTGFGTVLFDFDNDGWLDIAAANGAVSTLEEQVLAGSAFPLAQPNQLFRNRGDGNFEELPDSACPSFAIEEVSRGLAAGDVDNDGRVDMLLANNFGPARLLLNRSEPRHWIGLRLMTKDGLRDALGAEIVLHRPDGSKLLRRAAADGSYLCANDPRVVIGLGDNEAIAAIEIRWPDGSRERWPDMTHDQYHTLQAGTGEPLIQP